MFYKNNAQCFFVCKSGAFLLVFLLRPSLDIVMFISNNTFCQIYAQNTKRIWDRWPQIDFLPTEVPLGLLG